MNRSLPWAWILLAAGLLLLPGPVSRLLIDLVGGLTLTLLLLPLLAGGAALIGWQLLKRRLTTCPQCGLTSFGAPICPNCGSGFEPGGGDSRSSWPAASAARDALDPRDVTINVSAVDVDAVPPGDQASGPSNG